MVCSWAPSARATDGLGFASAGEKKRDDSVTPDSSDVDETEFSDEQEDEEDYKRGEWLMGAVY